MPYIAARFRVFIFTEEVSGKVSTCNSGSSMTRSNSNTCKNVFSLTSKEYVSHESMLILDLDHKRLEIRVITIKNIAVQIRVHQSSKIFHI